MKLHISKTLSLPLEALTKTFMFMGQRGSGKTNAGVTLCEEFAKADLPFVVVDPLGVWDGLRSSADGKGEGIPVFIFGGDAGDAPLEPTAGAVVADVIVENPGFFSLNLSLMRKGQRIHFMADFCERLFDAKATRREPLHLMMDEADEFAPQSTSEGGMAPKLLGAVEDIVRRGRSRGLGYSGLTQRPAVLNKNILTQADVLGIFRMGAPQDRKAIDDWVRGNATKEQIAIFDKDLNKLDPGDAFFWSPQWLKLFKRIHVRMRETFDSSATPEVGVKAVVPKVRAKVDVAAITARIAATVDLKKAEDPKLLRAQIATLQAELAATKTITKEVVTEVSVLPKETADSLRSFVDDFAPLVSNMSELVASVTTALDRVAGLPAKPKLGHYEFELDRATAASATSFLNDLSAPAVKAKKVLASRTPKAASGNGHWAPNRCEHALLEVLAQRDGHRTTNEQLSMLSGYKITGGFSTALAVLRSHGAIDGLSITDFGLSLVPNPKPMPQGRELLEMWLRKLNKCEQAILEAVYEAHPHVLSNDELAKASGYRVTGGFSTALAKLRKTNLLAERSTRLGLALAEAKS